jgi:hypothetical protein
MLAHLISRMIYHPDLVREYIKNEARGPDLIAFLRSQGITDPHQIGAILQFDNDDGVQLFRLMQEEIRTHFERVTGRGGGPILRWPGGPIVLTHVNPAVIARGESNVVKVHGWWFGTKSRELKLELTHTTNPAGEFIAEASTATEDPDTGESTAEFEVSLEREGTYDATIIRSHMDGDNSVTMTSQAPRGLRVE